MERLIIPQPLTETYIIGSLVALSLISLILSMLHRPSRQTPRESLANILIFVIGVFTAYLGADFVQQWALRSLSSFSITRIPISGGSALAAVFLADFTYYWRHRLEHKVRILWAGHYVHHSSPEYNFSTAIRLPWISPFMTWIFLLPMVLAGFHPLMAIGANLFVGRLQFFLHTEKCPRLPYLEYVLNTPSLHRVHHGTNGQYVDRNFGGIFIIWDRIFGTFQSEGETVKYGTSVPVNTRNPFLINLVPMARLYRELGQAQGLKKKVLWLFGCP